jgi:hypothetical protein
MVENLFLQHHPSEFSHSVLWGARLITHRALNSSGVLRLSENQSTSGEKFETKKAFHRISRIAANLFLVGLRFV